MIEWLKALVYGIVEGITEWLPVSSTGHLILLEDYLPLGIGDGFRTFFLVVIQLGAVLAAMVYFAKYILSRSLRQNADLLVKVLISCVPAAIIGVLFDDLIDAYFYNNLVVSLMLILFGVVFLVVDRGEEGGKDDMASISCLDAAIIGVYQLIAAVFPGVSRSGSTIIGGLTRGLSRKTAAEYTFIMAIPVMLGASLLKLFKLKEAPSAAEWTLLGIGSLTAFLVSLWVISSLIRYVKKNSFRVFGIYRIALGIAVLSLFFLR